jgi:hypothetical protein
VTHRLVARTGRALAALGRFAWWTLVLVATVVRAVLVALVAALFGWRYGSRP